MASKVNEIICGEYNHVGKAVLYCDTDSVYFSAYKILKSDIESGKIPWTKEDVANYYDSIGDQVNSTFPAFMDKAFNCPESRGQVIKAGREIVGSKALFITKKRYAVMVYDKEGKRKDKDGKPGEIKAMGLDLRRSDTPVFIQNFLSSILKMVLTNATEAEVLQAITDFRSTFRTLPGWEIGSPKRANNITKYKEKDERGKTSVPGHVRASINWNTLRSLYGDKYSIPIVDGSKVIVCKLKNNPMGFTSVAYPVDQTKLPEWFKELPFDHDEMEFTIIDKKLDNLIGVLGWDIDSTKQNTTFGNLFSFL